MPYLNPPPVAWLVLPLTALPYPVALVSWTAFMAGAVVFAWRLVATGGRLARFGILVASLGLYLVSMGIRLGQIVMLVMAAVALAWWLLHKQRPWVAGIALSVILLKPQAALLVPVVLLLSGYWRTVVSFALVVVPIAALSLLVMGPHGLSMWWYASSVVVYRVPGETLHGVSWIIGNRGIALLISGIALAMTLLAGWRGRRRDPTLPVAVGLAGSLLVAPYVQVYDLTALVLSAWLVLRLDPPAWIKGLMVAGYPVLEFANSAIGGPSVLLLEFVWLLALLMLSSQPRRMWLPVMEPLPSPARRVVVLPAYRAEKTVRDVVAAIPKGEVDGILLVDDASVDRTAELAVELGIDVIKHPKNLGYGGNQKTCYANALLMGAQVVVMLHPDGQYDPGLVPALCRAVEEGKGDIVLGSRWLGLDPAAAGMPQWKRLGNRFLTATENWVLGLKLSEYHTGYRAYSRRFLETIPFAENSNDFVFDTQVLVQAAAFGFRIGEVPAVGRYFKEASSVGLRASIVYGLKTLGSLGMYVANRFGLPCRWLTPTPIAMGSHGMESMEGEQAAA
jgi:glycosyltransferase involved in cell wall biosynthesis